MGAIKRTHRQARHFDNIGKEYRLLRKTAYRITRGEWFKMHKMKRLYPNAIAPERYDKIAKEAQRIFSRYFELHTDEYFKMIDDLIINGMSHSEPVGLLNSMPKCMTPGADQLKRLVENSELTINRYQRRFPWICGIDLASGKDQTGYGGRME